MLGTLHFASAASAICAHVVTDPPLGRNGIICKGSEETWTVPAKITRPTFRVRGADDALGGKGGFVKAKLPVESGETLDLKMGGSGDASSISHEGEPLIVAGGGDGAESNYLSSTAEPLEEEEPGEPVGSYLLNGSVGIEWYDAREPFELTASLGYVIVDIFDSEGVGFAYTGSTQKWIVPDGVRRAAFELFGGEGESGEPRGHILAGLDVTPGEAFSISVGGHGEDTTLARGGSFERGLAAGGDTERPNYLPWSASPAEEFWEGGGPESKPTTGYAIVHYWLAQASKQLSTDRTQTPAPVCIVPRLRGRTLPAARRMLLRANCRLGKVHRRSSRKKANRRVLKQRPPAGTVANAGRRVGVVVGARRCVRRSAARKRRGRHQRRRLRRCRRHQTHA